MLFKKITAIFPSVNNLLEYSLIQNTHSYSCKTMSTASS